MSERIRLAAVQAAPVVLDTPATIEKLARLTAEACSAPNSADLVCFPEAFVSCYPRGMDFGALVGSRSTEGRDWFRKYHESAVDIEGNSPEWRAIKDVAKANTVVLVVGVIEKSGGTLYCTAVVIGRDGTLLSKHRKLMPTGSERLIWGQGDGSGIQVAQTDVGNVGAVICWENYMPSLRQAMYTLGVEIYCAPTADSRDVWTSTMRHIATEGRCFVVGVNQFSRKSDHPADYPAYQDEDPNHIVTAGGSIIVGPLGDVLAGPVFGEEKILVAEVDKRDITRAKFDFDPVGHYSRPDVFQLMVNRGANEGVAFR